jgi:hypothetical protein
MNVPSCAWTTFVTVGVSAAITEAGDHRSAPTPCDSNAELFIDMSPNRELNETISLSVQGPSGNQSIAFVSGTSLSAVAAALNTLTGATGTHAEQSSNPMRLRLHSLAVGSNAFVSVEQVGGSEPVLFALAEGGRGSWMLIAHGSNGLAGDANCDGRVDQDDLIAVVEHWGECPAPPVPCIGDVNLNGAVDVDDLIRVILQWGTTSA